jgi:RimJ/RimL family protein N-acetyltransferase
MSDPRHRTTNRLRLEALTATDQEVVDLYLDPAIWPFFPGGRPIDREGAEAMCGGSDRTWAEYGLGYWCGRTLADGAFVVVGGCLERGPIWNLFWKVAPAAQQDSYAYELVAEAIVVAREQDASRPVVATILDHDVAAIAVAEWANLTVVDQGPDVGNADARVRRLLYADRPVADGLLAPLLAC